MEEKIREFMDIYLFIFYLENEEHEGRGFVSVNLLQILKVAFVNHS